MVIRAVPSPCLAALVRPSVTTRINVSRCNAVQESFQAASSAAVGSAASTSTPVARACATSSGSAVRSATGAGGP